MIITENRKDFIIEKAKDISEEICLDRDLISPPDNFDLKSIICIQKKATGFVDASPALRDFTVRSMLAIVPKVCGFSFWVFFFFF